MGKTMLEGYECERCGHKWVPRATTEDEPTICPRCKSPYWNKPRIRESKFVEPQFKNQKLRGNKFGK